MSCVRIQARLSRAIDDRRGLSAFEGHLAVCSDCDDFATTSLEFAEHYQSQVLRGIEGLRRTGPPFRAARPPLRRLIALAATVLALLSAALPPAPVPSAPPVASARVPLFDGVRVYPVDVPLLVWSGEPRLPRRLDQDLPGSLRIEIEPIRLPTNLRF